MDAPTGPGWAIVELMGHRTLAGYVTETTLAGFGMLRIDIYPGEATEPIASPMHPPSALYGLTPCTEDRARRAAGGAFYEGGMRLALPPSRHEVDDGPFSFDGVPWAQGADDGAADGDRLYAVEEAVDMLLTVDAHMNDRLGVAQRLASTFGVDWPRGSGDEEDDVHDPDHRPS